MTPLLTLMHDSCNALHKITIRTQLLEMDLGNISVTDEKVLNRLKGIHEAAVKVQEVLDAYYVWAKEEGMK